MLMRNHELSEGIEIKNQDGEIVGTSLIAARKVPVNKRWYEPHVENWKMSTLKHSELIWNSIHIDKYLHYINTV